MESKIIHVDMKTSLVELVEESNNLSPDYSFSDNSFISDTYR